MRKRFVLFLVMFVMGTFVFAGITAEVKSISGKVEIKVPGGRWKKAFPGMKIKKGDYVSTGFNSEAVLVLGNSQVIVKQLTRMELEKLVRKKGTVHTGLNLRVGMVRAKVRTSKGLKQDFRLRSPISTAAVRGTEFDYDGRNLTVYKGTVAFTNSLGQMRLVPAGSASKITGGALPKTGEQLAMLKTIVTFSTLSFPRNMDATKILAALDSLSNVSIVLKWGDETVNPDVLQ